MKQLQNLPDVIQQIRGRALYAGIQNNYTCKISTKFTHSTEVWLVGSHI